jgi:hypothetical protein
LVAGYLILIPLVDLPMAPLVFFEGGGVVAALHLPARVLEDPTPGPAVESSADSPLGVRTEIGMARIRISPSKSRMGEIKLSKACTQRFKKLVDNPAHCCRILKYLIFM